MQKLNLDILKNPDFLKNIFLALLAGILLGVSYPPFKAGFLAYFALVPLLVLLDRLKGKLQILRYSYFSIFVFHLISIYWIGGWGERTDVFMEIGAVALIIIHPFFYWIPISIYVYLKRNLSSRFALFAFPFLWTALEYLRSVDETAFPWLTLGNTQSYYLPVIQISSFIGVYGISFLILVFNVTFYFAYNNFRQNAFRFFLNKIAIVIIILLILFIYGKIVLNEASETNRKVKVGMIQPNIDPWEKWESGDINTQLDLFLSLSDSAISKGAEFLIWPETAIPVYLLNGSYPNELRRIQEYLSKKNVPLLTGLPLAEIYYRKEDAHRGSKSSKDSSYWYDSYNGTVLFIPDEYNHQTYGKIKLVPFSERTPYLEYVPFLGDLIKWQVGISNWSVGRKHTIFNFKTSSGDSARFSTLVCYESIFPAYNADFVKNGAQFLIVVTNDSWYGKLSGPYQHKQFAVFRAIENRRWIARSAYGGISCLIDPYGRIVAETGLLTRDYLVGDIYLNDEITFFTENQDLICYISLIISFLLFVITFIKKRFKRKA